MESVHLGAVSDDREEGEIVDDDFEDISDNSIIVPIKSGKSVSAKEHLPAISLSSVSEVEETKSENKIRHRHKVSRKKGPKCKKRRNSHRKSTCSDSDSDDYMELDRKLQKQLSAAVRVDDTEERHKNSLRSRLKGMTKLDESENCIEKSQVEQKDDSDEGDTELAELRLEALRTAVLNKFKHRKRRKLKENNDNDVLSDVSVKTDNSETNKENHKTIENCPKKVFADNLVQNTENKIESNIVTESNTPPEDDEDVLRALLLASMSKKITRENEQKKTVVPLLTNGIKHTIQVIESKKETENSVNYITNLRKRVVVKNSVSKNLQLPKVKPLIINVNQDSDSEDDLFPSLFHKTPKTNNPIIKPSINPTNTDIEDSVEKFLKEQRAKVEAQLSPIPKCPAKPRSPPVILEKSSVKLLPKVKQIEYQKLLQRLKNAEKRPRIRRASFKFSGEGKPIPCASKKVVKPRLSISKEANVISKVDQKQISVVSKVDPVASIKNEVRSLHKILKEIQIQKNGRLQIQEKYKLLMPVIKKINEASVERRKWEEGVKRLLQEVAEMKTKLTQSQQEFTTHVNDLLREKIRIDKSMDLKKPEITETTQQDTRTQFTSTPIKENPPIVSFQTSSLLTTPNNSLLIPPVSEKIPEPIGENQQEEDIIDTTLNPGDPNDIDKIYSKQRNTFLKYISPLDNVKREAMDDPFSIICPYDMGGNCRDPECIYKHLIK